MTEITREERSTLSLGKSIPLASQRTNIMALHHSIAHRGTNALYNALWNADFYWNTIKIDCQKTNAECEACQKFTIAKFGYNPQVSISATLPVDHVAIDTLEPLCISKEGHKYILVIKDIFTRFVFIRALSDKSAKSIAKELFPIRCEFEHPKIIQSDNGTEFVNELIEHLTLVYKWDHRLFTP